MSVFFAMFLGLVQGLTEFLPVSSSGHLSILQNFFHMENVEQSHMLFDCLLHLGTLIAVVVAYRKDIWAMIKEFFSLCGDLFRGKGFKGGKNNVNPARRLILLIIVSTLPLVLAFLVNDYVEQLYYSTLFIGFALLATGTILYISDKLPQGKKNAGNATIKDAILVGFMQAVAVLPGVSRSGSTITAGLMRRFDREFAVKYSFLLSIPAVIGANIFSVSEAIKSESNMANIPAYIAGVAVAAVSGYFAIRLVRMLADKGKFGKFAWYCWAVGGIVVIASIVIL